MILEVEQALVQILIDITGVASNNVRISYQNMPAMKNNTTDYIFVSLNYFDTPYEKPVNVEFDGDTEIESVSATKGITANLVFYGTNAYDNALKVATLTKIASYMKTLRKMGVYLICDTASPRRVPVLLNNYWYEQVYLDLRFYAKILYTNNRNRIESAEVNVISDHFERTINIEGD